MTQLELNISNLPPIEVVDLAKWLSYQRDNAADYTSHEIVLFSERWARLMQGAIVQGARIEEVAAATKGQADTQGISGLMAIHAIKTLCQHWVHGEESRRWYNLDVAPGEIGENANATGGVVSHAIWEVSNPSSIRRFFQYSYGRS